MTKHEVLDFLNSNAKVFIQIFCPPFGMIAQECYQVLKSDDYKIKKMLPKLVLAWFVCLIFGAFITENSSLNKIYPFIIMVVAFSYRSAADFIANDLFQFILRYLNSKNEKR